MPACGNFACSYGKDEVALGKQDVYHCAMASLICARLVLCGLAAAIALGCGAEGATDGASASGGQSGAGSPSAGAPSGGQSGAGSSSGGAPSSGSAGFG